MRVLFCGVRGSTPAPGIGFVRYGGHTSCVALAHDGGHTSCVALAHDGGAPGLVLDAGTGLQVLSGGLGSGPFRGTILLSHLHGTTPTGSRSFAAGDQPGSDVAVIMPAQGDPEEVLERAFSPPHFPITPRELRGRWRFQGLEPGRHSFEGFEVVAAEIPHKGGRTFGYRVSDATATVAYLPDHSPVAAGDGPDGLGAYHQAATDLAAGADLLIHDAQHTAAEFPARRRFGHATVEYAVGLATEAGGRQVALFHHDPARTDDELDTIVASCAGGPVEVIGAAEGLTLDL